MNTGGILFSRAPLPPALMVSTHDNLTGSECLFNLRPSPQAVQDSKWNFGSGGCSRLDIFPTPSLADIPEKTHCGGDLLQSPSPKSPGALSLSPLNAPIQMP